MKRNQAKHLIILIAITLFVSTAILISYSCGGEEPEPYQPPNYSTTQTGTATGTQTGTTTGTPTGGEFSDAIPLNITETNYDFDGGIQAVLSNIDTNSTGGDSGSGAEVDLTGTTITGIVTATGIYGASGVEKCFFVQDQHAGVYIFTNESTSISVADKVEIELTAGKKYFGMPEVTSFNTSITVVSSNNPIYAQEITASELNSNGANYVGEFVLIKNVAVSPATGDCDSYNVCSLDGQGAAAAHTSYDVKDLIAGNTATVGGPVSYSYSTYRVETPVSDYITVH